MPKGAILRREKNLRQKKKAVMAALRWLAQGYGFEIAGADVWSAYGSTVKAAEKSGRRAETIERIRRLASGFVLQVLDRELEF